ncbi:MAG: hypothetical protein KF708_24075 [Pirellulales bacterium]|nr:hypothetical protein [Pirellulales bacterium]
MSRSDNSLHLFLNSFTARDLAEPLPSFDEGAPFDLIRAAMTRQQVEVVGIRQSGIVTGWLTSSDVNGGVEETIIRPFDPGSVIADTASLNEVVHRLTLHPSVFVRVLGEIGGFIQARDFQKAPMRMWLFGLVTITELRVTRLIDEICPDGAWQRYLSPGRLHRANDLREERRRRNQQPTLLDCLQLADKGRIVARDEALRSLTRFPSRRAVEEFVTALQDLRNNLAHAQDISGDGEIIRDLATNVHRIVLGHEIAVDVSNTTANQPVL